jgi:4-amino-4-deoxy-L-arabinose transferase-like glycosyltransferase
MWPVVVALITLLALALRWYYVNTALVVAPIRGDAIQYYSYAWNLVHHGIYAGNPPGSAVIVPSDFRDPGYPLFLALWMKLFSNPALWYAVVLLSQSVLGALTVLLTMQLGRHWLNRRWSAAAGVLLAVWPHNIVITSNLLTETLFGFLCVLAMLICARACKRQNTSLAGVAGLCFGAAALTNAVLLPFGVLLALYLGWRRLVPRRIWATLCIGALVLPGTWAVRNMQITAPAEGQTSTDRALMNLVQGSWPTYHTAWQEKIHHNPKGLPTLNAIGAEYTLLRSSPRAGIDTIAHRLRADPWHYVAWYALEKPWLLWDWRIRIGRGDIYVFPTLNSPFDTQPAMRALVSVCHTINPLLAALALLCLLVTVVRRWRGHSTQSNGQPALEATLGLLVFITLVYSVLQSEPRYSIPFRSFEMLLAMTACSWIVSQITTTRSSERNSSAPSIEASDDNDPASKSTAQHSAAL